MTIRSMRPRRHSAAALATALLLAACVARPARGGSGVDARDGAWLSLDTRTSHGGLYRAGVVDLSGAVRPGAAQSWTVRVTDASGAPVRGARIRSSTWRPEAERRTPGEVRAAELGGGRYRIDGLRFGAAGWWNVPVRITANGRTDSLAFNLVIPGPSTPRAAGAR